MRARKLLRGHEKSPATPGDHRLGGCLDGVGHRNPRGNEAECHGDRTDDRQRDGLGPLAQGREEHSQGCQHVEADGLAWLGFAKWPRGRVDTGLEHGRREEFGEVFR
ncbi:MAG: hypothetical protein R2698_14335 [Microthrixaceae bacterium]